MTAMTIHAIYASTSGNVEAVVEKVAEVLRTQGIEVELHRAESTPLSVITENTYFLLATSTWVHGELNPFFDRLDKELKSVDLSNKKAAFIGCGDVRYEQVLFNQGCKILHQHWTDQQGSEIYRRLLINGEPYHILDTTVTKWALELAADLKGTHGSAS